MPSGGDDASIVGRKTEHYSLRPAVSILINCGILFACQGPGALIYSIPLWSRADMIVQ